MSKDQKIAEGIIRKNAIEALKQFVLTPDDLVTLKIATKALKAMSALILESANTLKKEED